MNHCILWGGAAGLTIRAALVLTAIYLSGALLTFGHLYRRNGGGLNVRYLLYIGIWPVYWPVSIGLGGCIDQLWVLLWGHGEGSHRSLISGAIGLFTTGYFLSTYWPGCSGLADCTGVAMRAAALYVPPVWLVYWTWVAIG